MKHFSSLIVIGLGLLSFTLLTSELKRSTGSPGGKTGSPGDGFTCTECHGGSAIAQSGWITSNIPSSGYIPGQTYTLTAVGTHTGVGLFGFEVTAEDIAANKVGSFIATDATNSQILGGGSSITHTAAGTNPSGNTRSWSFDWTAPANGTGTLTFYGAFNAANGNGSSSGDVIYTSELQVSENLSTGQITLESPKITVYPNPATSWIVIDNPGVTTQFHLVSADGKRQKYDRIKPGRNEVNIEGLEAGIYFLAFDQLPAFRKKLIIR